MNNPIDSVFKKKKGIKIMTHVVAGYPDLETSKNLIKGMADSGVDMVEIQIPFSDPLADGPTIMAANQLALESGITPEFCFEMAEELKKTVHIPLLFMSYANIPFRMGMNRFITRSANCGISGLIIPDLPYDEDNDNYIPTANKHNIHPIQVISPDMTLDRLKNIVCAASGFLYTTLKVGITGATRHINKKGLDFIDTVQRNSELPVAAGFGISSPEHIQILKGKADMAVIGSHIINLITQWGPGRVMDFLHDCISISLPR